MSRALLNRTDFLPYHVTARANNKELFPIELDRMWRLIGDECLSMHIRFSVEIHSLVLMPNHFHMLLTVPESDLGIVMHTFMRNLTKRVNISSGRSGHVFGGPYHWSIVDSSRYFYHVFKYVYRNPLRAGLCNRVEDYPYSTYFGLLGRAPLPFPLIHTRAGMELRLPGIEPITWLEWLNRSPTEITDSSVQLGLRKKIFDPEIKRQLEVLKRSS